MSVVIKFMRNMRLQCLVICWDDITGFFSCLRTACKLVSSACFDFQYEKKSIDTLNLVGLTKLVWCTSCTYSLMPQQQQEVESGWSREPVSCTACPHCTSSLFCLRLLPHLLKLFLPPAPKQQSTARALLAVVEGQHCFQISSSC